MNESLTMTGSGLTHLFYCRMSLQLWLLTIDCISRLSILVRLALRYTTVDIYCRDRWYEWDSWQDRCCGVHSALISHRIKRADVNKQTLISRLCVPVISYESNLLLLFKNDARPVFSQNTAKLIFLCYKIFPSKTTLMIYVLFVFTYS